ncbi:non-ribosomal peptide synthetase, partial [Myxococcus fulvus]
MFALQNAPGVPPTLPGVTVEHLELHPGTSKFDLTLFIEETPHGLNGVFEYATALFSPTTLARMAEHLRNLMEQVARNPHAPVHSLDMLSAKERTQWLVEWNDTARASSASASIIDLFAEQVSLRPQSIAVRHGSTSLTYGELDARANRLSRRLRGHGVSRARPQVGVCLPRTPELVVTLLAILKAGGAYVPLDPDYPSERRDFMARDSRVVAIVSLEALRSTFASGVPVLGLDSPGEELTKLDATALPRESTSEDLAHIIYTSGSTGLPKGVCIPHRGVVRMVREADHVRLGPDDRVGQAATIAFDASTFELWAPLLNGSTLVILDKDEVIDPVLLNRRLQDERITTLFLTTALFNLVARTQPEVFKGLRWLGFGGEAADPSCVNDVLTHGAPVQLANFYGPTENSTYSTWYPVRQRQEHPVPIGRPVSNSTAYVLDAHRQPVPIGVTGELHVGGEGLAWGYWNRPDLTAERFVPHPFSSVPGARLYRTGDLARLREDGELEFVGRADNQVKLRGFRIELGEIEASLRTHPDVRDAVVLVREDVPGDRRLVAYAATSGSATALREHLRILLPAHMVPSAFVVLAALPLTPNGKVDRRALPAPEADNIEDFVAPRTELEMALAAIWSSVLQLEQLSVTANFFDLGGHSLLATQVVSRARESLGVTVPVKLLFEAPTLERFARAVGRLLETSRSGHDSELIPRRTPDTAPPLSFAQERLWFLSQLHEQQGVYNMPFAMRLDGALDAEALRASLQRLVDRHESLRTTFPGNGAPTQHIQDSAQLSWEQFDLSTLESPDDEAARRVQREAEAPFNLENGPLFRARLFHLAPQRHVLL